MTVNWPKEPPALTMPVATLRFASGTQRAMADMSRPGPMAPAPDGGEEADQDDQRAGRGGERGERRWRAATSRAPASITGRAP